MAEVTEQLSVAEIHQLLRQQQSKVNALQKRREKLAEQLADVEQQIAELTGEDGGGTRFKNEKSLEEVIIDVLGKNKKGLGLAELTDAILKTGYRSSSSNFKNVVYQNVYKSEAVTRDEKSGRYVLA